jgi:hypothetical protein
MLALGEKEVYRGIPDRFREQILSRAVERANSNRADAGVLPLSSTDRMAVRGPVTR